MIDSNQSIYDLPYRARIMMTASIDNQKSASCSLLNAKLNTTNSNLHNLKPMNAKSGSKLTHNYPYSSGDLQPLQWLQQDAILSITPLDNEEEFVPGKDDITSVTTSPVKVEVVCESKSEDCMSQNSTIADYYRYQAMRAAMGNGSSGAGSVRPNNSGGQHNLCHAVNEYQKPPFSYTHIIFMAIETSPNKAMTVNDIYVWCETHFPYYTQAGVGWKNSLRHNLSINKSFKKISRDGRGGPGRGAYWVVEPRERNNLIDAIRRSPCSLGNFPFLSGAYPLNASNCYSNNIFQATHTFNSGSNLDRSMMSSGTGKLSIPSSYCCPGEMQSSARGPLLRIGGHLTDASNLIRSTPVIQRLNDATSSNIIELTPASSQITLSTVPLIQFDHIKFESDDITTIGNDSTDSNDPNYEQQQQQDCRGKVCVLDDPTESNPDLCQAYADIIRGLMYGDAEKFTYSSARSSASTKDGRGDIGKLRPKLVHKRSSNSISGKNCVTIDDGLPTEALSESGVSNSSLSNKELSELSDTDFNWRMNIGLQNQKERKHMYLTKFKSSVGHRKSLHIRNRINNITRAPHPDHVYALLQEFLTPANTVDHHSPDESMFIVDKPPLSPSLADDRSISVDLFSQTSLSKRSKHKLHIQKRISSKTPIEFSDSDNGSDNDHLPRKLARKSLPVHSSDSSARKGYKNIPISKISKHDSRLLKENSAYINNKKRLYRKLMFDDDAADLTIDNDDDEERENRFYDNKNEMAYSTKNNPVYRSVKSEPFNNHHDDENEVEESIMPSMLDNASSSSSRRRQPRRFDTISTMKRMRMKTAITGTTSEGPAKRKVGRPKKSECRVQHNHHLSASNQHHYNRNHANHHNQQQRLGKDKLFTKLARRKLKSSKRELKYLKEINAAKDIDSEISNKDEQVAINILANLQRKNQQERIKNMYNLSTFIDRNHS